MLGSTCPVSNPASQIIVSDLREEGVPVAQTRASTEGGRVGHIKRTNFCCVVCDVHLCIGEMANNCFYAWHHNVEYWRA